MKLPLPAGLCFSLVLLAAPLAVRAEVALPAIFSDHMVLQADVRVPVWGTAAPGEQVAVTFAGQTVSAAAGADGRWLVALTGLKAAAAPQTLTVKGTNTIEIRDVLVGEVWLGSGQSNMAMTVARSKDFETEQRAATYPQIRHFREDSPAAAAPQRIGKGRWVVCAPDTVGGFSAALYFFGRELHRTLGVPVGLINSSVGGTPIESWIDPAAQKADPVLRPAVLAAEQAHAAAVSPEAMQRYERALAAWEKAAKAGGEAKRKTAKKPQNPAETAARKGDVGGLFLGKIEPLIPYAFRGALWYQGEANSVPGKAALYGRQLELLVRDWRTRWGHEFPFAWVQLPNFTGTGRDWPTVREQMLRTLRVPRTGMAIAIDVGEAGDIHPKDKQSVGHRLALWALGTVYGRKVPATSGPLPAGHAVRGHEIVVSFRHADGGLTAKGVSLAGFVVAGADRVWKPAQARIEGDNVVISSPEVAAPVAARYAWENLPTATLFNGAGLPATPFRTDDWD